MTKRAYLRLCPEKLRKKKRIQGGKGLIYQFLHIHPKRCAKKKNVLQI